MSEQVTPELLRALLESLGNQQVTLSDDRLDKIEEKVDLILQKLEKDEELSNFDLSGVQAGQVLEKCSK